MEQIKQTITRLGEKQGNSQKETNTPTLPTFEQSRDQLLEQLRYSLGVSSLDNTFENFKTVPGTQTTYDAYYSFATRKGKPLLFCYGERGNGKTHLMEATAIQIYKQGGFARIVSAAKMYGVMKNSLRQRNSIPTFEGILENYCNAKVLLLDDLSMGHTGTEWEASILEQIICHRYHERLMTAINSNIDAKELPDRVLSRLQDKELSVIVLNRGADYRRLKSA